MNDPAVVETAAKVLKAVFGEKLTTSPPITASEDFSEFVNAGVPSMFFNIGVYEPERVAAARNGSGPQLPSNHSPLFAPVPKPTIQTGVTAMTLAVLSAFDQRAKGQEALLKPSVVIASEAKQSIAPQAEAWIASSLSLLAMTMLRQTRKTK